MGNHRRRKKVRLVAGAVASPGAVQSNDGRDITQASGYGKRLHMPIDIWRPFGTSTERYIRR